MPRVEFASLPDHGRVWVFPASRRLAEDEVRALLSEVDAFLEGWAAHGTPLRAGRDLVEDQFLVVGVDEDASQPSGCSIDALVNRLEELGKGLSLRLVDHAPVWFRDGDEIRTATRAAFRALAGDGSVTPDTPVFDTSVTRLATLREQGLEGPARERWHGRAFFREQRTP